MARVKIRPKLRKPSIKERIVFGRLNNMLASSSESMPRETTYRGISHVRFPADKISHGDLDFGQEVTAIVLENGNVEHHDAFYPRFPCQRKSAKPCGSPHLSSW